MAEPNPILSALYGNDLPFGDGGGFRQDPVAAAFGLKPNSPQAGLINAAMLMGGEQARNMFDLFSISFGQQNKYDIYQSRQYQMQLMQAAQTQEALERARIADTLRNFSMAAGAPSTINNAGQRVLSDPFMESTLQRSAGDITPIMRIASTMFPEQVDTAMMSAGGSRFVASQAITKALRTQVNEAGVYNAINPGEFTTNLINELYGKDGGRPNFERTGGLTIGRTGLAFEELTRRGVIGAQGDIEGSAQKAGKQMEEYAKALKVMSDIFGDAGNPNAPMRQVAAGLDAIAQGGMGRMDAAQLTRAANEFRTVSQFSTIKMSGAVAAMQLGSSLATAYGVDPRYMVDAPTKYGAAYSAYAGMTPAYDRRAPHALAESALRDEAAGAASQIGQAAGAIINMGKVVDADSPLGVVAAALAEGKTEAIINGERVQLSSIISDRNAIVKLAEASGLQAGTVGSYLTDRKGAMMAISSAPGSKVAIRDTQSAELKAMAAQAYRQAGLTNIAAFNANELSEEIAKRAPESASFAEALTDSLEYLYGRGAATKNQIGAVDSSLRMLLGQVGATTPNEEFSKMGALGRERGIRRTWDALTADRSRFQYEPNRGLLGGLSMSLGQDTMDKRIREIVDAVTNAEAEARTGGAGWLETKRAVGRAEGPHMQDAPNVRMAEKMGGALGGGAFLPGADKIADTQRTAPDRTGSVPPTVAIKDGTKLIIVEPDGRQRVGSIRNSGGGAPIVVPGGE